MGHFPPCYSTMLFSHVNTAYTVFSIKLIYNLNTLCLNGTLFCVDFMDVTMGDEPLFSHVNTAYTVFIIKLIYNLTTLCLNGTLFCVDFMDVTMGDVPLFSHVNTAYTVFIIKLIYNLTTLCLNGTLSCVDFIMDVILGDIPLKVGRSFMITITKFTQGNVIFKRSVFRLY